MEDKMSRHTVWMRDDAWSEVIKHYKEDNCAKQCEYVEKAVRFYSGYLDAEHADSYLPRVLSEVLEGKLAALGQRMGRQVFKLSVEELMMASVLAAGMEISPDELRAMRVRCIKDVKRTNGEVGFEDAVRLQEALEQDA